MPTISELIENRVSVNHYDTTRKLTDEEVADLVALAIRAPSAFNLQNWKFIAVRSDEAKARLLPLAFGQRKVVEAAVTIIVCGTLEPHHTLSAALKPSLDAGIISDKVFSGWIATVQGAYKDNPTLQRDEAIRSGSLAAMTLMLAAQGKGLISGPMIGFNAPAVAEAFGLQPTDVPVCW